MVISLIKSLLAVSIVSGLMSLILFFIGGINPIISFSSIFFGQIFVYYLWTSVVAWFVALENKRLENERIAYFNIQGIDVGCAYCRKKTLVPINLSIDNDYVCEHCNKENSIYINITTTQVTNPLAVDRLSVNAFIDEEELAKKAIIEKENV